MENSDAYDTQPELIGYFGTSHMCKKILGWLKAGAVATTVAFIFAYICLHYQICKSCLSHFFSCYTATVLPLNTTQSPHLLPFLIMFTHYCFHRPCHDRDNSQLAPSENARKANTGTRKRVQPPNGTPASERATRARSLFVLFLLSPLSPCTYYI